MRSQIPRGRSPIREKLREVERSLEKLKKVESASMHVEKKTNIYVVLAISFMFKRYIFISWI